MNNSEMKKLILAAVPKRILTLEVGYGINQVGSCNRDGSLESYDHQFSTKEEAQTFEQATIDSGYSGTLRGTAPVTIWDEIEAELSDIDNDNINYPEGLEVEIPQIAKKISKVILKEIADKL